MRKVRLISNAETREKKIKAKETLTSLFTKDFPLRVDVMASLNDSHWENLKTKPLVATHQIIAGILLRFLYQFLPEHINQVFNSAPSFAVDVLLNQINEQSIASYLIRDTTLFKNIPTRELVQPSIKASFQNFDEFHKEAQFFAVYGQIRMLASILDVCLYKDPSLLWKEGGCSWIEDSKSDLFRHLINYDPIFLQTFGVLTKIKLRMPLWELSKNDLRKWFSFGDVFKKDGERRFLRRALFFALLREKKSLLDLSNVEISDLFNRLGICSCSSDEIKKQLKKLEIASRDLTA